MNELYKGVTVINIKDIEPYEFNPRKNEAAVNAVANSIKEFGFKVPIVLDKDNVIVAGHTRYKAAIKLGLQEVPCIIADDLNEEQIKAFRLADNKTAELAEWDFDLLDQELKKLSLDMTAFGFEELEEQSKEKKEKPDVEFSEVLEECHNYIVLYFDNDIDWLQAQSVFDIKQVQALSTKKTGKPTKNMKRMGVGRVQNGAKALNKLLGDRNNENQP